MNIVWDSSVSSANQATILAAIAECLFDFAYIPTTWTVRVTPNAGHGGKFEAVTYTAGPGQPARTDFAPGLFTPGDPLYNGLAFAKECVIHELGHVVTLGNLPPDLHQEICNILGIDYATQWAPSGALGASWLNAGQEAAAEIFKDFYFPGRVYDNRTNFQIDSGGHLWFIGCIARALQSVQTDVPISKQTASYPQIVGQSPAVPPFVVDLYDLPDSINGQDSFEIRTHMVGALNGAPAASTAAFRVTFGVQSGLASWTLADWTCAASNSRLRNTYTFPQVGNLVVGDLGGEFGILVGANGVAYGFQASQSSDRAVMRTSLGDYETNFPGEAVYIIINNPSWVITMLPSPSNYPDSADVSPIVFTASYRGVNQIEKLVIVPSSVGPAQVTRIIRHRQPPSPLVPWPYQGGPPLAPGNVSPGTLQTGTVR